MRLQVRGVCVGVGVVLWGWVGGVQAEETVPSLEQIAGPESLAAPAATAVAAPEEPLRLSMEFQNAPLKDVLKAFSQQSGINVIASADVGEKPITLYLEDVTVMDALDRILQAGNLLYERAPNSEIYLVRAKPADRPAGPPQPITRVYKLKYARASKSLLARAAASLIGKTPFEAGSGESTGTGAGRGGAAEGGTGAKEAGIDLILKELLSDQGAVVIDTRTNSLIITDQPEIFPRLEAALMALDVRTPQIMVGAEIIETTLTKFKDLGFEWGTGSEGNLFTYRPSGISVPNLPLSPFRYRTLSTDFDDINNFDFSFTGIGQTGVALLDATEFTAVLQALESDTDTKILARPKVLTLDNESAIIRLVANEAIGFTQSNQQGTGTTTSKPERASTGVVLVVTPQINDTDFITMLVEPSVTKTVASKINAPTGQATPRDPKTRSTRALVRVRSGDTLVLGGLIDRSEEETMRRMPIMSGIPIIGEAFKNQEISNTASELIAFVTPTIIKEGEDVQVAASTAGPMGLREQEPSGGVREESIEQSLNAFEQPAP